MKKLLAISLFLVFALSMTYALAEEVDKQLGTENVTPQSLADNMDFEIDDGILLRYSGKATKVVIPNGVTGIDEDAFPYEECKNVTSITLPDSIGLEGISNWVFGSCEKLKEFRVGSENPHYTTLDSILFSKDITEIVAYPVGLKGMKYTIPNSVTRIRNAAFAFCGQLTSVSVPDSLIHIGEYAFAFCSKLKTVTLPDGLQSIGFRAFCGCDSITEFKIPDSVISIDEGAFSDCARLKAIQVSEKNEYYRIVDGALIDINKKLLISFPVADKRTTYVTPDGILTIGNNAFRGCEKLKSIKITQGVTSIGYGAFSLCKGLTDISMPEGLIYIENSVFHGCKKLQSLTIPEGVLSIGSAVFSQCTGLKSITIPTSVTNIGVNDYYKATLFVTEGSYAHQYAVEKSVAFKLQ